MRIHFGSVAQLFATPAQSPTATSRTACQYTQAISSDRSRRIPSLRRAFTTSIPVLPTGLVVITAADQCRDCWLLSCIGVCGGWRLVSDWQTLSISTQRAVGICVGRVFIAR
jgi:hypothetical protein